MEQKIFLGILNEHGPRAERLALCLHSTASVNHQNILEYVVFSSLRTKEKCPIRMPLCVYIDRETLSVQEVSAMISQTNGRPS